MSDLPRHGVTRAARLARLPAGFAGRAALGSGKRLGGRPAELVTREIQERTADQVFRVLGELKGGAMKLWLESPWTGPPPFRTGQVFRLEEAVRDDRYVIRAELPGLDPENDIEVTVDGRILTIRAERRQQDNGPCRSEFRYGSLARAVRLPARVDAADVTARYDKGVLEVSAPVPAVKPEGTRISVQDADAIPEQPSDQAG